MPYSIDQRLLLPPDMCAWLAEGHLALFLSDVADTLDLSAIYLANDKNDDRGRAYGGFRRSLLRGLEQVRAEFALIALTHNLLELFRSAKRPALA